MKGARSYILYAIKDGKIINIAQAKNGERCVCPACGQALIARRRSNITDHFAHQKGICCEYGYEGSLQLAAVDILSNKKEINIPAVYISFKNPFKKEELVENSHKIKVNRVTLEHKYSEILPDLIIYSGENKMAVKPYTKHKIESEALNKMRDDKIPVMEINLSNKNDKISTKELENILLSDSKNKMWSYHPKSEEYLALFNKAAQKRRIIIRENQMQAVNCPLKLHILLNKSYAVLSQDCFHCKYCISYDPGDGVYCTAELKISGVNDFTNEKINEINERANKVKTPEEEAVSNGICPHCGEQLVERHTLRGTFMFCKNYPLCRFKSELI